MRDKNARESKRDDEIELKTRKVQTNLYNWYQSQVRARRKKIRGDLRLGR